MARQDDLLAIIWCEIWDARRGDQVALANLSRAATALTVVADPDKDVADFVRLSDDRYGEPLPGRFLRYRYEEEEG